MCCTQYQTQQHNSSTSCSDLWPLCHDERCLLGHAGASFIHKRPNKKNVSPPVFFQLVSICFIFLPSSHDSLAVSTKQHKTTNYAFPCRLLQHLTSGRCTFSRALFYFPSLSTFLFIITFALPPLKLGNTKFCWTKIITKNLNNHLQHSSLFLY